MAREKCPICGGKTIGSMNTRYCINQNCDAYNDVLPGILIDKIDSLKESLDIATKTLEEMDSDFAVTPPISMFIEKARKALAQIRVRELQH